VRLGRRGGCAEYVALLSFAYLSLPALWLICGRSVWIGLPLLTLPGAVRLARALIANVEGPPLNAVLAGTARLTLLFSLLLSAGWLL
jgi:1,4-dihydroxy-2-naphthoate octaprenyltransferase